MVLKAGGCHRIIEMIQGCLDPNSQETGIERYRCVLCGCILNLANDNGKFIVTGGNHVVKYLQRSTVVLHLLLMFVSIYEWFIRNSQQV